MAKISQSQGSIIYTEYPFQPIYRRPRKEILCDPLTWDFEQRDPNDGLDRLIDDGVDPFDVLPQPDMRAVRYAQTKRVQSQIPRHARKGTLLSRAEIAYSLARGLLRVRPTNLPARALAALWRATPASILTPEVEVLRP